jgi:bifunctional DNA-binding transcriptional regulator/antitoxin component of YhaV-PrlF toxin-antitoxin module
MADRVRDRRSGRTRVSAKNQVTLPVDALRGAGIRTGDRLRAEVRGPGQVLLVREIDPIDRFPGALTGVYERDELARLRDEWD